jgi:hypothetical protein
VITGMNLLEGIGVGAFYGAGMEFTVGAGVAVFVGAQDINFNGILAEVGS